MHGQQNIKKKPLRKFPQHIVIWNSAKKETNTSRRKIIQKRNFAEKVLVSVFWDIEEVTDIELLPSNKIEHTSVVGEIAQWARSGHMP